MSMKDNLTSYDFRDCRQVAERLVDSENDKSFPKHTRNAYLVVAVLIATSSYQSILSPPGGGWQISQNDNINSNVTLPAPPQDKSYFSKDNLFYPFYILNSIAFYISVSLAYLLIHHRGRTDHVHIMMFCSVSSISISYFFCSIIMAPPEKTRFPLFTLLVGELVSLLFCLYVAFRMRLLSPLISRLLHPKKVILLPQYQTDRKVRLGKYVA
ncbi:uncharacterized protein LOC132053821 [Lycium ferocissimum]|uniref:uncharacterized protein LOC132053821 n=1 Tax=Lycium ferocissimum TaxID=112874 RepID=UPI002815EAAF|nr:uncharacterized protein LOC132053821 [Lycium ferocissimum]